MAQVSTWFSKYCSICGRILSKNDNAEEVSIVLSDEIAFILVDGQPVSMEHTLPEVLEQPLEFLGLCEDAAGGIPQFVHLIRFENE